MPVIEDNITIEQGAAFLKEWRWTQTLEDGNEIPMDLSNYDGVCQIREGVNRTDTLIETPIVSLTADGDVTLRLGATQTLAITNSGNYQVDLINRTNREEVIRFASGAMEFIGTLIA